MKNFQILTKLGEGAFSVVYKVKRLSDGLEYALKKVGVLGDWVGENGAAIAEREGKRSQRGPHPRVDQVTFALPAS